MTALENDLEAARDADDENSVDRILALLANAPRTWRLSEAGTTWDHVVASSAEQALALAEDAFDPGVYDATETMWIMIDVRCDATGERDSTRMTIEPNAPDCADGDEHDWQSPLDVVGGIAENPGVWVGPTGAGVVINEACVRCGCGRTTDTNAQNPDTGEQGLTSMRYTPDRYPEAVKRVVDADGSEVDA